MSKYERAAPHTEKSKSSTDALDIGVGNVSASDSAIRIETFGGAKLANRFPWLDAYIPPDLVKTITTISIKKADSPQMTVFRELLRASHVGKFESDALKKANAKDYFPLIMEGVRDLEQASAWEVAKVLYEGTQKIFCENRLYSLAEIQEFLKKRIKPKDDVNASLTSSPEINNRLQPKTGSIEPKSPTASDRTLTAPLGK